MTLLSEKTYPDIAEMRKFMDKVLSEYPDMTLKVFISIFDKLIRENELELLRRIETAQLKELG